MRPSVEDLYDYGVLRGETAATMFIVHVGAPVLVLGGSQSTEALAIDRLGDVALRRRRGGGGLVLLRPGDLWVDWWIPTSDPRWTGDVRKSSVQVGQWWRDALAKVVDGVVTVHDGPLSGDMAHRLVCFAGRGPGEVFVNDRKAVGVTQWRVREGVFVSTVIHSESSRAVVNYLRAVPDGLESALDHLVLSTLGIDTAEELVGTASFAGGNWQRRTLSLTP